MLVKIRKDDGRWYTLKLIRGPRGEKGDPGDPGTGLVLLDAYDTLEELRAAHPTGSAGDCYAVGAVVYTWSTHENGWKALGAIVGKDGQDGTPGKDGAPGQDGLPGENGKDGVGIASVVQTTVSTEDGGENVVTMTLTDGKTATFRFKNGSKGSTGATGATPTSFPASGITGTLAVANGGTGVTNLSDLAAALGVGSSAGFVTGTYVGTLKIGVFDWREVNIGFKPKFVIVWSIYGVPWNAYYDTLEDGTTYDYSQQSGALATSDYPAYLEGYTTLDILRISDVGFRIRNYEEIGGSANNKVRSRSYLNYSGRTFCYIAGK